MDAELPSNPRGLKAVVIILGVIFLAMLALFIYGLATRVGGKKGGIAADTLALAAGEQVVEIAGAGERLVLRLRDAAGAERLLYVDPETGKTLGTTAIVTGP